MIYGHVHNSIEEYYFRKCLKDMNNEDFFARRSGDKILQAYNVGCMMPYMGFTPRTLAEILKANPVPDLSCGNQNQEDLCTEP